MSPCFLPQCSCSCWTMDGVKAMDTCWRTRTALHFSYRSFRPHPASSLSLFVPFWSHISAHELWISDCLLLLRMQCHAKHGWPTPCFLKFWLVAERNVRQCVALLFLLACLLEVWDATSRGSSSQCHRSFVVRHLIPLSKFCQTTKLLWHWLLLPREVASQTSSKHASRKRNATYCLTFLSATNQNFRNKVLAIHVLHNTTFWEQANNQKFRVQAPKYGPGWGCK